MGELDELTLSIDLMDNDPNPYSSPGSDVFAGSSAIGGEAVTDGVLNQLNRTKGWAIFLGVVCFLFAVLSVIGGIGVFSTMNMMPDEMGTEGMMLGMAIAYVAMGASYVFPGVKLCKFASKVSRLNGDRSAATLEAALNEQRVMYKYLGIIVILGIVAFIGTIIFAAATAVNSVSALG